MGANAFLYNESSETVKKILHSNTVDEASKYIENREFFTIFQKKFQKNLMSIFIII